MKAVNKAAFILLISYLAFKLRLAFKAFKLIFSLSTDPFKLAVREAFGFGCSLKIYSLDTHSLPVVFPPLQLSSDQFFFVFLCGLCVFAGDLSMHQSLKENYRSTAFVTGVFSGTNSLSGLFTLISFL